MPPLPTNRLLLLALSVALGAALLIIAFLLGRESARTPEPLETAAPAPPALHPEDSEAVRHQRPERADLAPWDEDHAPKAQPAPARIQEQPDGSLLLSNRGAPSEPTLPAPGDTRSDSAETETSAYFMQMDVIQSEAGAGDPNSFAMELIKAAMGGSTAGFDELIADMQRMEREARGITPPPSCETYHQTSLATLAEGRAVLEEMKSAIMRRDIESLTATAKRAAALQTKAEALQQMRERISAEQSR